MLVCPLNVQQPPDTVTCRPDRVNDIKHPNYLIGTQKYLSHQTSDTGTGGSEVHPATRPESSGDTEERVPRSGQFQLLSPPRDCCCLPDSFGKNGTIGIWNTGQGSELKPAWRTVRTRPHLCKYPYNIIYMPREPALDSFYNLYLD